jgi:hypothetical protein
MVCEMSDIEKNEDEVLGSDVSDEALETAAGTGGTIAAHYTLYFCTAVDLCPGP